MIKKAYWLGLAAPFIFCITYFIMYSLRPEYNNFTKAISELGSVDAPNKWFWNCIGYMLVGLCISIFSIGLSKSIEGNNKWPLIGLFLCGVFMSLSGVFPGDFGNRQSMTMIVHSICSIGSFIFFLIGAFTYPQQMKKDAYWKPVVKYLLIFTWMSILGGVLSATVFYRMGAPGLGQRFTFFFFFVWIFYAAWKVKLRQHYFLKMK